MGKYISFSQGLLISVVSMMAVFLVLILIAFIISGLKAFSEDKKEVKVEKTSGIIRMEEPAVSAEDPDLISEELVVIITAALAANLEMNIPDINIRTIKRIPQRTGTWSNIGNTKQGFGRL